MSEDAVMIESAAPPEVQAEAEKMGWIPPARYKGDSERFVDADTFLERGETVLPIVKKQLALTRAELDSVRRQSVDQAAALRQAQEAIEQIEERHSVATQKAVENARRELKSQLAQASANGDHEAVAELTDQMTQLKEAETVAKEEKKVAPVDTPPPPEVVAWNAENPWFGTDKRKTAFFLGIAQDLREKGDTRLGAAFFNAALAEMEAELGGGKQARTDKVEGGRSGGAGEERSAPRGKSYASLPADAKAACDADLRRFVGENKRYKTAAEWRGRFAELYFSE